MTSTEATDVLKILAASAPCDFPNRVKAIEAVQHVESELAVLSAIRTALEKKPDVRTP